MRGEEGGPKAEACFDVAAEMSASRPDKSVGCETARSTERQAYSQVWIDKGRRSCGERGPTRLGVLAKGCSKDSLV